MRIVRSSHYTAERPWGADLIAAMTDATVRLHWTDQPYPWHVNDGAEVFAVMDGAVDMHYRADGEERVARLQAGDIFYADQGDAHSAHPCGAARILVIERAGSP
jgi:mannose-6-phosphate isomerase-like protein (cupin superfamily)